jgi:hypothetical protein
VAEYRNCLAANPSRVNTCDGLHHIMDADAQVLSGSALPQQNSADTTQGRQTLKEVELGTASVSRRFATFASASFLMFTTPQPFMMLYFMSEIGGCHVELALSHACHRICPCQHRFVDKRRPG